MLALDFDIVVNQLAPNVGVLYATILALTLQVLYARFTRIQENATTGREILWGSCLLFFSTNQG